MPLDLKKCFPPFRRLRNFKYFADYERIQRILLDEQRFLGLARGLDEAIRKALEERDEFSAVIDGPLEKTVMATVLREQELKHGFKAKPQEVPVLTGVVSAETFLNIIDQGRPMKDVLVSFAHGEYTHRIQWYIITLDYEQNRSAYHKTPLELYRYTYELGPCEPRAYLRENMWACLFDRPEKDDPSDKPVKDTRSSRNDDAHSHFSCPEYLHAYLVDPMRSRPLLPSLHKVVKYRHDKRVREGERLGGFGEFKKSYIEKMKDSNNHLPEVNNPNDLDKIFWKK